MVHIDQKMNRLALEKSPYLRHHAMNPVDWYPWGEEAFEKARKEDKPIFLSIGYASCHWCHVMERESFEDLEVAEVLNRYFVSVKVDKEERPDVDHVHMSFCQAMTGDGGWPMTLILTPERKPFFAATYLPKETRGQLMGLLEVLARISALWLQEKERVLSSADFAVEAVLSVQKERKEGDLDDEIQKKAFASLVSIYDEHQGGFFQAPKFPLTHHLYYLLWFYKTTGEEKALDMLEKSLISMYKGGLFDHVGGGFYRYAVDARWLIPHFEKMLYDNALLSRVYLSAYVITGRELYKKVSVRTLDFLLEHMKDGEGALYSSMDADSEGEEGKFYLFEKEELLSLLGEERGEEFAKFYGVEERGNFEGKNILNLYEKPLQDLLEKEPETIMESRKKVLVHREKRVHPAMDDKILSSWNGMMLETLALAGRLLKEKRYTNAARDLFGFIEEKMTDEKGILHGVYREGLGETEAFLDGYVHVLHGLLALYENTLDLQHLSMGKKLGDQIIETFFNGKVFQLSGKYHESLSIPAEEIYDSATPSGNSEAVRAMARLYSFTGEERYLQVMEKVFMELSGEIIENPKGFTGILPSYDVWMYGPREIVLSGKREDPVFQEMLRILQKRDLTGITLAVHDPQEKEESEKIFSFIRETEDGTASVFFCKDHSCSLPVETIEELLESLMKF